MSRQVHPQKLVCVFAHPDDEAFGPGGAVAHYAKECEVHIICVTDGDANGNTMLGSIRKKEMQESCKILGVKSVTFLGYHDGDLSNNLYHKVGESIKENLDKLKPDTIMTFDPNGVSGHLDHIAIAMITSYLFERVDYARTLMYYCEGEYLKERIPDYFVYVPPGYKESEVDLVLDVSGVYDTKIKAMRKHVSQKDDCDWIMDKLGDHLREEMFRIISKNN